MVELIARLGARLARSLITWPDARGWRFSVGIGAVTLATIGAVGFSGGLYAVHRAVTAGLPLRLATVLIAPAFAEEAAFRGLLIPGRGETARPAGAIAVATGVFTLWHVAEAETFLRAAAPMFLRPDFLACAAILGLGCGILRWRTGSIWPGVAMHWLMVTIWQTWLGGLILH